MTRLMVYSDPDEPVTAIALKFAERLHLVTLSARELLLESSIADRLDEKGARICWHYQGACFGNDGQTYLLNRCAHLSKCWFEGFVPADREYAQSECHAYLLFALASFAPLISELPGQGSLMGWGATLPEQWHWANRAFPSLQTPDFYLGEQKSLPPDWPSASTIFSDPHNIYGFRPNEPESKSSVCFAFLRPPGTALLCSVVGLSVEISPIDAKKETVASIEKEVLQSAQKLARTIASENKFFAADVLLFAKGRNLTLGMFANLPYGSMQLPTFETRVLHHLSQVLEPY